jgi:WD40 repeat protein
MSASFDVLFSYNWQDEADVLQVYLRLKEQGVKPWLDKVELGPVPWREAIQQAMAQVPCCLIFVGAHGFGANQKDEIAAAQHLEKPGNGYRVIPVLLPGVKQVPAEQVFLNKFNWVRFHASVEESESLKTLVAWVRNERITHEAGKVSPECPYRGLERFEVEHAGLFFGREELTGMLFDKVSRALAARDARRFLAIEGASGSGKSSLARAGLLARLKNGALQNSEHWRTCIVQPGGDPLYSLALQVGGALGQDTKTVLSLKADLAASALALKTHWDLHLAQEPAHVRFVLLVDQFEELYTTCKDEEVRQAFIDNLLHASAAERGRGLVLVAVRADFVGKCAAHAELARAMSDGAVLVGPMTEAELRQAIERPAAMKHCAFEPGLVDQLLSDVRKQPGNLPLLQFALKELWQKKQGNELTLEAYRDIGGVQGALEKHAETIYAGFSGSQQEIARRLFLRLTNPGEGTEDTRRRVPRGEVLPAHGSGEDVEKIIQALSEWEARLLTVDKPEDQEGEFVEVAHEALIRGWSRLRRWIDADRTALQVQRRLTEAGKQWREKAKDEGFLLQAGQLAVFEDWARQHVRDLNAQEKEFLDESRAHANRQRSRRRRLVTAAIVASLAAALSLGVMVFLERAANRELTKANERERNANLELTKANEGERNAKLDAERNERKAKKELFRFESMHYIDQIVAADKALQENDFITAGLRLDDCRWDFRHIEYAFLRKELTQKEPLLLLPGHTGAVRSLALSADGKRLFSAGDLFNANMAAEIKVWSLEMGKESRTLSWHTHWVNSLVLSADGKRLFSGGADGTINVWDLAADKETLTLRGHTAQVNCLALRADGKQLFSGSADGTIKVWDVEAGKETCTLRGHTAQVNSLALSADGKRLFSGSVDQTIKVWDREAGTETLTLRGHTSGVNSLASSVDDKRLFSGSVDQTIKVWDLEAGKETLTLRGHTAQVNSLASLADGKRLFSGSADGTVKVWDLGVGKETLTLRGHTAGVSSLALSGDGKRLFSGSVDQTIKVWDLMADTKILTLAGHTSGVSRLALSTDGKRLVSGSDDTTIKVWDLEAGKETFTLRGHTDGVLSLAMSSDGKDLFSGSFDKTIKVWDLEAGKETLTLRGHTDGVSSLALSYDGKRLFSGSWDQTIKVWALKAGKETLTLRGHKAGVLSLALSSDGKRLFSGSGDQTIKVWDLEAGKETLTLRGHTDGVRSLALSSDGKRLFSGRFDKTIKVWDLDPSKETLTLHGHSAHVNSLALSSDGKRVVSGSNDQTIKVWDLEAGKEALTVRGHSNWVSSLAMSADGKRLVSGSDDKTIKVWELEASKGTLTLRGHTAGASNLALSADGKCLVSASRVLTTVRSRCGTWRQARKP